METQELIDNRARKLAYTIEEIVQQIKNKKPLPLYQKGDRFDSYGIIERVYVRIEESFRSNTYVGALSFPDCADGLIYYPSRNFDHKPLLKILEESLKFLNEERIRSEHGIREYYASLRKRLLELRYN